MDGSSDLIITPNFNGVPYLEELVLASCSNLRELHPSIGKLKKLKLLHLGWCQELTSLPDKFEMESLVILNLTYCLKVRKIPEFVGNMERLEELLLEGSAIIELPSSVECLTGLKILTLRHCKNLVHLPNTICCLTLLDNLDLFGCSQFNKLPEDLGKMVSLKVLVLGGTAIKELPSSVQFLTGLTSLVLTDCKNFVRLPSTICSLKSLHKINLSGCSKFDKLPNGLGNITSLKDLNLSGTAIKELPSSVEFLIGLKALILEDCKNFVPLPRTIFSLESLELLYLSRCPKFVNLENFGNLKHLTWLLLEGTAIEVLPSSIGHMAALNYLDLKDCKNLVCLPNAICNLKQVWHFDLTGCSKITNLPENLGNMEGLRELFLGGTAIKELPSSTIHLKKLGTVSFKGCQLSSSSLTSMPTSDSIDLSDCNLSAIPSGIDRILSAIPSSFDRIQSGIDGFSTTILYLRGNDFVSLPESISQFSELVHLYLDGCKSLRSLTNIPSKVYFICLDNCTSLERLPEPPNNFTAQLLSPEKFTVQCFNCFKLAYNIQNFSNIFQVSLSLISTCVF